MKQSPLEQIQQKLVTPEQLKEKQQQWQGQKIVFTNGCFDILHYGHLYILSKSAELGDKLIIGLNSDSSVKRIKGNSRPIQNQQHRALLLAAMEFVDAVILFEEDTPYNIIQQIQPDILVKGGDYNENDVVGADIVKAKGGNVVILEYINGHSTSGIEEKLKKG